MGIKVKLSKRQINNIIKDYNIVFENIFETKDGISDTTYVGIDKYNTKYIFKLYEKSSKCEVQNEIVLLNALSCLPLAKPYTNYNNIKMHNSKVFALYSYIKGSSPILIESSHIVQIAKFISIFHQKSKNIILSNKTIHISQVLKTYLKNIIHHKDISEKLKCDLLDYNLKVHNIYFENNCIIHGDLFPDNTKFNKDILTGVFDLSQACKSNRYFDIAIIINSWCFKNEILDFKLVQKLLDVYNTYSNLSITIDFLRKYILYAAFFYALKRLSNSLKYVDFDQNTYENTEYLIKFRHIEESNFYSKYFYII